MARYHHSSENKTRTSYCKIQLTDQLIWNTQLFLRALWKLHQKPLVTTKFMPLVAMESDQQKLLIVELICVRGYHY